MHIHAYSYVKVHGYEQYHDLRVIIDYISPQLREDWLKL